MANSTPFLLFFLFTHLCRFYIVSSLYTTNSSVTLVASGLLAQDPGHPFAKRMVAAVSGGLQLQDWSGLPQQVGHPSTTIH